MVDECKGYYNECDCTDCQWLDIYMEFAEPILYPTPPQSDSEVTG